MEFRRRVCVTVLLVMYGALVVSAWGQLKPGIVVEKVGENSEAEKAGLQEGDILLNWSRGDAKGDIRSPFDLSKTEIEEPPRGNVTFEGIRGTERKTWILGPNTWGLKTLPNLPENLLAIYRDGQKLARAGKPTQAVERWREAAKQVDSSQPPWLRVWFLLRITGVLADVKQWKEVDDCYQDAAQTAAAAGSEVQQQVLRAWGDVYSNRLENVSAEKHYQQALVENQRSKGETFETVLILNNLGDLIYSHDPVMAEKYLSRALDIGRRLAPDSLPVAASLDRLGVLAIREGDLRQAETYLNETHTIKAKLAPGTLTLAQNLRNLGIVAWMRGDLSKSDEYYHQALAIQEKLVPGNYRVAQTLNNLSNNAFERGELTRAEQYDREALAIKEKVNPDSSDTAHSIEILGNIAYARGDLTAAKYYYNRALKIKQKLPDSLDIALTISNLGEVAEQERDLAKAEDYFQQSLNILRKVSPDSYYVAESLDGLGQIAEDRSDFPGAEEYFHQALLLKEKKSPESIRVAQSLNYLADVARNRGDLAHAEEQYLRARSILEKQAPESPDYVESLAGLAEIMRARLRLTEANQLYQQALGALESAMGLLGGTEQTRAKFRAQHIGYYKNYVDLLLSENKPALAFQVLERLRARSLLETLSNSHIDIRKGIEPVLFEREHALRRLFTTKFNRRFQLLSDQHNEEQMAILQQETKDILEQYHDVETQIRASSTVYADLTQPQPLSAQEVQEQLLDDGTILLEYSLGKEQSYLFAITHDSLTTHELPKKVELEGLAKNVHDLLTVRTQSRKGETTLQKKARLAKTDAEYAKAVAKLSQLLLGPIASQLGGKRLLIVSDGALQYIPFSILQEPASNSRIPVPLIAGHEIVNLPSASVLAVLRQEQMGRKEPLKAVAVLADPVFSERDTRVGAGRATPSSIRSASEEKGASVSDVAEDLLTRSARDIGFLSLPRLPFTRQEADAIISVTPAGDGLKAVDFKASRELSVSLELSNYRIVHLATHGLLDSEHPELSGLVFSLVDKQGRRQNGFLGLEDIYNLDLPVDMVVLSACETGLGKEISGEGLIGLTRGFMYAGASRVVASLWSVDDVATAELMSRFYKGILRQGLSPAAALRQAQVEMWRQKRWRHPYYWGAFVIQGEWKAANGQVVN